MYFIYIKMILHVYSMYTHAYNGDLCKFMLYIGHDGLYLTNN